MKTGYNNIKNELKQKIMSYLSQDALRILIEQGEGWRENDFETFTKRVEQEIEETIKDLSMVNIIFQMTKECGAIDSGIVRH